MTVKPLLTYDFSIAKVPGVVAANNYMSAFNPVDSGLVVFLGAFFVSTGALNATTALDPMRGFRASGISGGVQVATSDMTKFNTKHPDPKLEIRTGNPTATLGTAVFNSPAIITTGTGGSGVHDVTVPPGSGPFVLWPGEGFVIRTAAGDLDQVWNITLVWGERRE